MVIRSIICSGDWHIRTEADKTRINKVLPKTTPLILMGDLIDTGIDRGMQWNQDTVDLQVTYLQEILKSRKVLGYVLGNHEDRIVKRIGLNPYRAFLGEEKTDYFVKLASKQMIQIAIEHGTRNNQNPLAQLRTMANIYNADIVALGHDHSLGMFREGNQWLVRTGNLQPYPEYARKALMLPKIQGYVKVSLKTGQPEIVLV